jgi:hypothetical protein
MILKEDNPGFVNFPVGNPFFSRNDTGKTIIYLVAFEQSDMMGSAYILSNNRLICPGDYVTDDISGRHRSLIDDQGSYFVRDHESIPLTSSICIGWSDHTYEFKEDYTPWYVTFRDLTGEGRKLYYSLKKLHNNKEIRILTFNNI